MSKIDLSGEEIRRVLDYVSDMIGRNNSSEGHWTDDDGRVYRVSDMSGAWELIDSLYCFVKNIEKIEREKQLLNNKEEDICGLTINEYINLYQSTPGGIDIWEKLINGECRLDSCWHPCVVLYDGNPDPRHGAECYEDDNIYIITRNQKHLHLNKKDVRMKY